MKTITLENGKKVKISEESYRELAKAIGPEFKVGDWVYKTVFGVFKITEVRDVEPRYKKASCKEWLFLEKLRYATENEIENCLEKERIKRGYKKGTKYICAYGGTTEKLKDVDDLKYYIEDDILTDGCGGAIYCNGKWAEIVKEETVFTYKGVDYSKSTLESIIKKVTQS